MGVKRQNLIQEKVLYCTVDLVLVDKIKKTIDMAIHCEVDEHDFDKSMVEIVIIEVFVIGSKNSLVTIEMWKNLPTNVILIDFVEVFVVFLEINDYFILVLDFRVNKKSNKNYFLSNLEVISPHYFFEEF